MKISVCIPMYNESKIIESTARTLDKYMRSTFDEGDYEIIFSDDGSRDACGDIVKALNLPSVKVIGEAENHGKGYAVRKAFLEAKGEVIMFTDADLAYGVDVIGRVSNAMELDRAQTCLSAREILRRTDTRAIPLFVRLRQRSI